MIRRNLIIAAFGIASFAYAAAAQPSLPPAFKSRTVASPEGADIFVRSAGSGPVVVLLHGYAETSDSWAPLAGELVKSYTVVVPDLRGIGRSSRPAGGYDKKTQAADIRAVVTALGYRTTTGPEPPERTKMLAPSGLATVRARNVEGSDGWASALPAKATMPSVVMSAHRM